MSSAGIWQQIYGIPRAIGVASRCRRCMVPRRAVGPDMNTSW